MVVVAILGVLAAIAVPNVGKFMGQGHQEAANTELHNVQTAVLAGMADAAVGDVDVPGTFDASNDVVIVTGNQTVGDYIVGGNGSVQGTYTVASDGTVTQTAYPGT
ncbi:MAG: type II secretion system protein [Dehalococcoidales bacterium]